MNLLKTHDTKPVHRNPLHSYTVMTNKQKKKKKKKKTEKDIKESIPLTISTVTAKHEIPRDKPT